jgi:hypothetical protein
MKRLVTLAYLCLVACGQPTSSSVASSSRATASPPPSASSSPSGALIGASVGGPCGINCASTVAIVGLDGRIHAQATFTPPSRPSIGCEGGFVTALAQVAAGSVFYLDSSSAIHRLSASGNNQVVAKLPILTSQQLTWFAVSPDGTKVIASVIAWPPLVSPPIDPSQGCPQHVAGDVREELELATVGGSTTTLWTKTLSGGVKGPPAGLLAVAGWDDVGPVATTNTYMAYIGYVDGTVWLGPAAHLDSQGEAGSAIGGSDCNPAFGDLPDGSLVCYDPKHPTVRDASGHTLWSLKPLDPKDNYTYGEIALSPDASRVAFSLDSSCCYVYDSSVIRSRDGVRIGLVTPFQPQGWIDTATVIGQKGHVTSTCSGCPPTFVPDDMALIRVANPTNVVDLGFKGSFLGVVQSP